MTIDTRDLSLPGQKDSFRETIQSIFIKELLNPSPRLWLSFARISDIEVIDNTSRQFSHLKPDWPTTKIKLSEVLRALLERSQIEIIIVVRKDQLSNERFLNKINHLREPYKDQLFVLEDENIHHKNLVGDSYMISGSVNLTYFGTNVNKEHPEMTINQSRVSERITQLETEFGPRTYDAH